MIANPHVAYLLKDRAETLGLMKQLLENAQRTPPGDNRSEIMAAVKELGAMSQKTKLEIEESERSGPTPSQVAYYKIIASLERPWTPEDQVKFEAWKRKKREEEFYGHQQPHPEADREVRTP